MWSGKIVAWVIVLSTALITYDVAMRYLSKFFGDFIHSIWFTYNYSYDMSYYLYAIFFMLGGAYALSRAQMVRGDMFYRSWSIKAQGTVDFVLYIFAFWPAMLALISVGAQWAAYSTSIGERAFTSFAAPPLYPLKWVIPLAATLMAIQGVAETARAFIAMRTGVWPQRLADVEETETILARQSEV